MIRRFALGTMTLLGLAGAAAAADLPTKKTPSPPPPVFKWAGFYAGANIGVGFLDGQADPACINNLGVPLGTGCAVAPQLGFSSAGLVGGVQAG